ncbi:Leucine Rich repeat [Mactra antiquata]
MQTTQSGKSSRNDRRSSASKSRAHLTATPHSANKNHQFQPLKEEDLETVLDFADDILPYDETGKRCYSRACQKFDVVPSSNVLSKLSNSKSIDCKHYGLGPRGTMALSIALVINSRVTSLNLQGNDIGQEGINYLQKLLCETHTITDLNISDNKLGSYGARAIHKILMENRSLHKLELSGEEFSNADAELLTKVLQDHPELEYIDLSHNNFDDDSAAMFQEMIAENSSLHTINLSWNQFRTKGSTLIAKGLKENACMKTFNFSWNGIGDDGATEFAKMIKVNSILTSLDLTCCRIAHEGFMKIITALNLNESLEELKIGKNNIPEEFAIAALSMLRSYPTLKLETLDMSDCTFTPNIDEHIQNLKDMHRHIDIIYGYSTSYGKNKGDPIGDILREGLECLREFCRENNVSLVELFSRFDTDNSMSVSLQEFQEGLKEAGVPLSLYKIEQFANALDKDGDGEVDYSEMVLHMKSA